MRSMLAPTLGRIVIYHTDGRNGLSYDLPALINCTQYSHPGDYPDGQQNPCPAPSSEGHVHLTVLTPGGYGTEVMLDDDPMGEKIGNPNDEDFVGAAGFVPGTGTYVELDVPPSVEPKPGHWRWPEYSDATITIE